MGRGITSIESIIITTGKAGQVFYTHKNDKDMTALASYYKRELFTERGIFVSGTKAKPTSYYLTKVTLGGMKNER